MTGWAALEAALGAADVGEGVLAAMVAASHDQAVPGTLEDVVVLEVDYDLDAISTKSRHRVVGRARYDDHCRDFRLFVKQVQSWERSPLFAHVPQEVRALAARGYPWSIEPAVYRSDLAARLPDGLRMPRCFGTFDLDEQSASVWLEDVPVQAVEWDLPRFERAAYLLGRLAGSPEVAELAGVGGFEWSVATYAEGRLQHQVVPMLRADELWRHPLVADAFDDRVRDRLLEAADRVWRYTEELAALPRTPGHGDACPNNLLVRPGEDASFTLIDFGFFMELPLGFDLGQLLVGDVQIGRRDSTDLAARDEACLRAYRAGLEAEGYQVDERALRRAHALQLLLFTGLSALPVEHLDAQPDPRLRALARDRAALAVRALDLVDATG